MHMNMHGNIMYHLSAIAMYIQFSIPDQENLGDSLFASILNQLANVPQGYTVKHFCLLVVKNMACTRESLLTILTPLLQDGDLSFKEVMEQIGKCNSHVNVHIALTCVRLFLCIPVVLLKPVWKKVSGQSAKQHTVIEWHAVSSDQKKANGDKLFVLWNGDKFVIPVTPTPVAELNTNLSNIEENFDEVKDLIKETIEMLPKSNIKKDFKDVQKMVESSSDLLNSCKTSTGWADLSLPKLCSVESAGSIAASRIPTRRQPNPEKVEFYHKCSTTRR